MTNLIRSLDKKPTMIYGCPEHPLETPTTHYNGEKYCSSCGLPEYLFIEFDLSPE